MRSEKEVNERISTQRKWVKKEFPEWEEKAIAVIIQDLTWFLEGEPRYSVAEIEKIHDSKEFTDEWNYYSVDLVRFIASHPKKIKEILESD